MSKPLLGLVIGTLLGLLDGLSAWFYPEARSMLVAIVIGSTIKGLLTGLIAGWLARRWKSAGAAVACGLALGLALSYLAALQPDPAGQHHYVEIMLPGALLGAIVGYAAYRFRGRGDVPRGTSSTAAALLVVFAAAAVAGQRTPGDNFAPMRFLEGTWRGTGTGQPGVSTVEREYRFELNGRFLVARNKSTYAPQEKNPKGEVHEDVGYISFDSGRRRFVMRQFHVEGFVNQYVAEPVEGPSRPARIVFVSESIENIPPGWRARETYQITADDEFTEVFELAEPGKDFSVYSESRLRRVR